MRTFFLPLFIVVCGTAAMAQIPTAGLTAWYPFDGNGNDISGNDYHASTVNATLTTDRFGTPDGAYHFNPAQTQYIEVPYMTPFTTDSKTVSAWIRTTSSTQYQRIVTLPNSAGYTNFSLSGIDGQMTAGASYNSSGLSIVATSGFVNDGQWHHVVGVIEYLGFSTAHDYVVKVYVDGQLSDVTNYSGNQFMEANEFLQIGRYDAGWGEYYDGDIDDILFYDRALSDSEIAGVFSPCATITVNNPQTICSGNSYVINGNTYTEEGAYNDTLSAVSGCDSVVVTQLTVTPLPSIEVTASPDLICLGELVDLAASGADVFQWDNSLGSGDAHTLNPQQTTTYTAYGITDGCQSSASVTVTVNTLPEITATAADALICEGQSTELTASGSEIEEWLWTDGISTDANVTVSPVETTTYTVFATDLNGCVGYAEVTVEVETCVGIAESETLATLDIYPNPCSSTATIADLPSGSLLSIVDASGRTVLQSMTADTRQTVNTAALREGIYLVRVDNSIGVFYGRLMVVR
ncbi:MAG: T9SS type A sorting domain-containing protein [Flavobacteriales bacterium]|nr:T9SS type A sorting domain-containing protein [Flavobacteriales bacterium]